MFCSALQCVAACCGVLFNEFRRLFAAVLQRVAACCSVLQCVTVRSYVLQYVAMFFSTDLDASLRLRCRVLRVLQRVTACFSVLQYVAVC